MQLPGNLEKKSEIIKDFRNQGVGIVHNPATFTGTYLKFNLFVGLEL